MCKIGGRASRLFGVWALTTIDRNARSPISKLIGIAVAALISACVTAGCAPYVGWCGWLEVTGDSALEVTAPRTSSAPQECDCLRCAAPGTYQLRRPAYAIELWTGDRWFPALYLRARSAAGEILILRSDQLSPVTGPVSSAKANEYDVSVNAVSTEHREGSAPFVRFPDRLSFTVLDRQGSVLGTESV